jgi:hypothetical protein
MAAMRRLTLDTSSVIHGAQAQLYDAQIDQLVELARSGRIGLWITAAFAVDQERAPVDKHQHNLAWLAQRPFIGTAPGSWRLGYSGLGGVDGLLDDDGAAVDASLKEILLSGKASTASRQKITDVQHLTAHFMAGHDAFVTSDQDDMLDKREVIQERTGIVLLDPTEAVVMAHGQSH